MVISPAALMRIAPPFWLALLPENTEFEMLTDALVTITAETSGMQGTPDELLRLLAQCSGVIKAEVLAG